jgi:hypothetical protein
MTEDEVEDIVCAINLHTKATDRLVMLNSIAVVDQLASHKLHHTPDGMEKMLSAVGGISKAARASHDSVNP